MVKIDVELNIEEFQEVYCTLEARKCYFLEEMLRMEREGYREGDDYMKASYETNCKYFKLYQAITRNIKRVK